MLTAIWPHDVRPYSSSSTRYTKVQGNLHQGCRSDASFPALPPPSSLAPTSSQPRPYGSHHSFHPSITHRPRATASDRHYQRSTWQAPFTTADVGATTEGGGGPTPALDTETEEPRGGAAAAARGMIQLWPPLCRKGAGRRRACAPAAARRSRYPPAVAAAADRAEGGGAGREGARHALCSSTSRTSPSAGAQLCGWRNRQDFGRGQQAGGRAAIARARAVRARTSLRAAQFAISAGRPGRHRHVLWPRSHNGNARLTVSEGAIFDFRRPNP